MPGGAQKTEIETSLVWINALQLKMVLPEPLLPEERLTVTLDEIKDPQNPKYKVVFKGAQNQAGYSAVAFNMSGLSLHSADFKKKKATVKFYSSYAVDLTELKQKIAVSVAQREVRDFSLKEIQVGRYELSFVERGMKPQEKIQIKIDPVSLPGMSDIKSSQTTKNIELKNYEELLIYGPYRQQSSSGFSLEFICDDQSVNERSWFWNSELDFDERISDRCVVDTEQIAEEVRFDPPLENIEVYQRERGFAVVGDFAQGTYTVELPSGILSREQAMSKEPIMEEMSIPMRKPMLMFFSKGRYLPTKGWEQIPFRYRNTSQVEVEITQIRKENLHNWIFDSEEYVDASEGDLIFEKTIKLEAESDQIDSEILNISKMLGEGGIERSKGLYEIKISDLNSGAEDTLHLQITDIAMIVKRVPPSEQGDHPTLWVWTQHAVTGRPLSSTKISLVRPSGSMISECTTNSDGFCLLDVDSSIENYREFAIFAERKMNEGEELAYLSFKELKMDLSTYDIAGEKGASSEYRISAHSDRGAYRPGDQSQLFALIRNKENSAPKSNLPVVLSIYDSKGQKVQEHSLTTNKAGVVAKTINVPTFASTGAWRAAWEVSTGKDKSSIVQSYNFRVEDFVPERMSVQVSFPKREQLGGEALVGNIEAQYLFGASASGSNFEVTCRMTSVPFVPAQNKNYTYGSPSAFEGFELGRVRGVLDEDGVAQFECPNKELTKALPGMGRLLVEVDVLEAGSGRTTTGKAALKIHPAPYYVGLQIGADKIEAGNQYPVSGIIVDWKGKKTDLIKELLIQNSQVDYSYSWYWDEDEDYYGRSKNVEERPLKSETISVKEGRFSHFVVGESRVDAYRIRAQSEHDGFTIATVLDVEGYYSWYSRSDSRTPDPFRPDSIEISAPKSMDFGDEVQVSANLPYPGKLLWSIELDGVIRHEWVDADQAGLHSWNFNLRGEPYSNNVYVSAMLIKDPLAESPHSYLPSRAVGIRSIAVRNEQFSHKVNLELPKEVQPNNTFDAKLKIDGEIEDGTVALVALVDEGILSLTKHKSPDPTKALFPKSPLEVTTFETVGWSIALPSFGSGTTAGGDGVAKQKRAEVVKPVALWSGIVDVPKNGELSIPFTVPEYSGKLRAMVLTASPNRFGTAQGHVLVRDPLTLQATLPRFISKGDQFQVPVFLTNLSGADQEVELSLKVKDGEGNARPLIKFLGAEKTTLKIKEGESTVAVFQAQALAENGFAQFEVQASAGNLVSKKSAEVPFKSMRPTERENSIYEVSSDLDLAAILKPWSSENTQIWATANPYARSLSHVKHLIRYPYGCIEQTSSSLRPLLTAAPVIEQIDPGFLKDKSVPDMIQSGVERLASMQTGSGGFAYWPGGYRPHFWGTVYATHTLMDAQANGHPVMSGLIEGGLDFIEQALSSGNYDSYRSVEPYAHYVLARGERGKAVAIRDLLKKKHNAEDDYLLKAALYLSGDHSYKEELIQPQIDFTTKKNSYSFRSTLRTKGMLLAIHQELFGARASEAEPMAQSVASSLERQSRYYSTQELVWGTYSLARRAQTPKDWKAPQIKLNGKILPPESSSDEAGTNWSVWDINRKSEQLTVTSQGSNSYLVLSTEGVKKKGEYEYGSSGLSVSREILKSDGTLIDEQEGYLQSELGDVIYVRITVENKSNTTQHELALVDHLPAGWEPELIELNDPALTDLYSVEAWEKDHYNIRDQQLEVFGDLNSRAKVQVVYAVRSVTAGSFYLPPVEIEAMYDPTIWGRAQGGAIKVLGPWAGSLL
ncbi:MAG: hypothetical protein CMK59_03040 [Proteobacteria bacterium]|nr:hypothetical protein [Pseudomonadota bacterium]